MSKLEVNLGDACFTVNINFPDAWPAKRWHDTTHFHTDSEIHTILEGNAVIEIGGKDVHIDTGDILLLAPQASHYPKSCNDTLQTTNFSFGLTRNDNHDRKEKTFLNTGITVTFSKRCGSISSSTMQNCYLSYKSCFPRGFARKTSTFIRQCWLSSL